MIDEKKLRNLSEKIQKEEELNDDEKHHLVSVFASGVRAIITKQITFKKLDDAEVQEKLKKHNKIGGK